MTPEEIDAQLTAWEASGTYTCAELQAFCTANWSHMTVAQRQRLAALAAAHDPPCQLSIPVCH